MGADAALILVDVQNDFLPGGALAVPDGDAILAPINACIEAAQKAGMPVVATRDWHPDDHCSFTEQGGIWPAHCVANTPGAGFAPNLNLPDDALIVSKATSRDRDAYSGFDGTDLDEWLKGKAIRALIVAGLATDYCVKATALDARRLGYEVTVLTDAVRGVAEDTTREALDEMARAGCRMTTSREWIRSLRS